MYLLPESNTVNHYATQKLCKNCSDLIVIIASLYFPPYRSLHHPLHRLSLSPFPLPIPHGLRPRLPVPELLLIVFPQAFRESAEEHRNRRMAKCHNRSLQSNAELYATQLASATQVHNLSHFDNSPPESHPNHHTQQHPPCLDCDRRVSNHDDKESRFPPFPRSRLPYSVIQITLDTGRIMSLSIGDRAPRTPLSTP